VGACKEKEGREKGRTGTGAVKREGRSGTKGNSDVFDYKRNEMIRVHVSGNCGIKILLCTQDHGYCACELTKFHIKISFSLSAHGGCGG